MDLKQVEENYPFIEDPATIIDLPEGWKKRFVIPMLDDLWEVFKRNINKEVFRIASITCEDGKMRYKLSNDHDECGRHMEAWAYIAEHTCAECGAFPVPQRKKESIKPLCNDCLMKEVNAGEEKAYLRYFDVYDYFDEYEKYSDDVFPEEKLHRYWFRSDGSDDIDLRPFYELIGYDYDENDKYQPIRKMPEEDYERFIGDVAKEAEEMWIKFGEPVWDDIPDTDEVRESAALSLAYVRYFYGVYFDKDYHKKEVDVELLPNWYAFPYFGMCSIHWRMGTGEGYVEDFGEYLESLTPEEKDRYDLKYPLPFYMDDENMFDMTEFVEEDKKETVAFVYRNKETGEETTINGRYRVFAGRSEEQKERIFEEKRNGLACFQAGSILWDEKEKNGKTEPISFEDVFPLYKKQLEKLEFVRWYERQETEKKKPEEAE